MKFIQILPQYNTDGGIAGSIHHFFDFLSINRPLDVILSQDSSNDTPFKPTDHSSLNRLVPDKSLDFLDNFGNHSLDVGKVSTISNHNDNNDALWGDLDTSNSFTAINEFLTKIIQWANDILEYIKNAIHGGSQNPDDDLGDGAFPAGQIWVDNPQGENPGVWDSKDFLLVKNFDTDAPELGPKKDIDNILALFEERDLLNSTGVNNVDDTDYFNFQVELDGAYLILQSNDKAFQTCMSLWINPNNGSSPSDIVQLSLVQKDQNVVRIDAQGYNNLNIGDNVADTISAEFVDTTIDFFV